jgi:hypothetical protein
LFAGKNQSRNKRYERLASGPSLRSQSVKSDSILLRTDYFTRTAVGKSNIFVNLHTETKYFYQDLDGDGQQLNGDRAYTVTFAPGQLPSVKGFWSLTLYNQHHFFSPNDMKRYSVGTKNKR